MRERDLAASVAEQLRANGFVVELNAQLPLGKSRYQLEADIVAWAGDASGELVADVVVEVKANVRARLDDALAAVSRVAAVTGARRAFLYDGEWFEADPTFTRATPAVAPRPRVRSSGARVPESMLASQLFAVRNRVRAGVRAVHEDWVEGILREAAPGAGTVLAALTEGSEARLSLARLLAADDREFGVPSKLALAMARLLAPMAGWTVFDPACRLGGCLWATASIARAANVSVELRGWDSNARTISEAEMLATFCGAAAEFTNLSLTDALRRPVAVDGVISAPPLSLRLHEPVELAGGARTLDGDVAFLDRIAQSLKPGGRAVVAVAPKLLFAESAAPVRERIAREMRVTAVIELPRGLLNATKLGVGVVVIENRPPASTLVAKLSEDWEEQLDFSGSFYRAYLDRLKEVAS